MKPGNNFNARVTYMGNNRWKSLGTFAELDEGDMSNFDNNELFIPEITNVWYSPDHTRYGYVINDLASGSLQIGISDTGTERNSADDMVLELPVVAKSVNDVSFIDACRVIKSCQSQHRWLFYLGFRKWIAYGMLLWVWLYH